MKTLSLAAVVRKDYGRGSGGGGGATAAASCEEGKTAAAADADADVDADFSFVAAPSAEAAEAAAAGGGDGGEQQRHHQSLLDRINSVRLLVSGEIRQARALAAAAEASERALLARLAAERAARAQLENEAALLRSVSEGDAQRVSGLLKLVKRLERSKSSWQENGSSGGAAAACECRCHCGSRGGDESGGENCSSAPSHLPPMTRERECSLTTRLANATRASLAARALASEHAAALSRAAEEAALRELRLGERAAKAAPRPWPCGRCADSRGRCGRCVPFSPC